MIVPRFLSRIGPRNLCVSSTTAADVEFDHLEFTLEIEFREIAHRSESGVIDERVDLQFALLCFFKELRSRLGIS